MKTLLTTINAKYIHSNLAIRILYEMNQDDEGLDWKEFALKEDNEKIATYCAKYDIIAFSCYIWNISRTLEVAALIKSIHPSAKIMLGGPEVTYEWEPIIALPSIDFIIIGEGEVAFQSFLRSYPKLEEVPSLVWKSEILGASSFTVVQNKLAPQFDLRNFKSSMPYKYDDPLDLKQKVLYIETARGCPYKCEFCLASLDNQVRQLPLETIKATLLFLMQHGKVIKFLDRTFNVKKDFTLSIFNFILENHQPGNVFQFEITADIVHPDIVSFINEKVPKGLFRFEIGIQTVNQRANLEVSRKQNFEKTKQVILSLSPKVEMHLDLIVGLALDYWEDIKYSIEEVFKLYAPELQLGFLKFLKGTPVREKAVQHGFVYDPMPPYQIIESNYLSKGELEQIVKLEHALEIYWNSGKAINTLKYVAEHYSIFDFLLGLGQFFGEKSNYHRYSLKDVFVIALEFSSLNYPDDTLLKEIIDIDFLLFNKVKTPSLYLAEVSKSEKNKWVEQFNLNHHQYRFGIYPVSFDFEYFKAQLKIIQSKHPLIICYTGTDKPTICKVSL